MYEMNIKIYHELCVGCGECIDSCDYGCFKYGDLDRVAFNGADCIVCHNCDDVCEFGAMELEG
jgi:NAD-dependent dihydropyrimidine dehydrogenase PreA subunit